MSSPGPEDVAEAIRQGRPPSSLLADADEQGEPARPDDDPEPAGQPAPEPAVQADGDQRGDDAQPGERSR